MTDRYDENPLLRLLDCYILDAIGELPDAQRQTLEKITPQLQQAFGSAGSWHEIVAEQMGLLPNVPLEIEMHWASYREAVRTLGHEASPAVFVRDFVAQNFPGLADGSDS